MLRKIIAIDHAYAARVASELGFDHFPAKRFRELVAAGDDVDVLETLITIVKRVPVNGTPEEIATIATKLEHIAHALECAGCRVILCPAKPTPGGGFKQSDDARLMVATLALCYRLRPDFLTLVAADGDFAPLIWELRAEGIRTEVVATHTALASDLRRACFNVIDLEDLLQEMKEAA